MSEILFGYLKKIFTITDIQKNVSDIRNSFLGIQNNYFEYLKKMNYVNSACHINAFHREVAKFVDIGHLR